MLCLGTFIYNVTRVEGKEEVKGLLRFVLKFYILRTNYVTGGGQSNILRQSAMK